MNNKLVSVIAAVSFLGMIFCIWQLQSSPKLRYVRSADLVYNYDGMKEAHLTQQKTTDELVARVDTLKFDFQHAVNKYNQEYAKLSKNDRLKRERLLRMQEENLAKYSKTVEEKIQESDQKLTEGVLNQINAFVEEYAKEKNYDLVLGTTSSGNILYAKEGLDITQEVIDAINDQYKVNPQVKSDEVK